MKDMVYICNLRFRMSSKGYYRAYIPIHRIPGIEPNEKGIKILRLHIEDLGEITIRAKLPTKYIDLHIPSRLTQKIEPDKEYKIYLVETAEADKALERNVIIYSGGRKARIEIPEYYLKTKGINKETILRIEAETSSGKQILYGRYRGKGPHIQSLPPTKQYPNKITIKKIQPYNLKKFTEEFNKLARGKYGNLKLHHEDEKLYLEVDGHKLPIQEYSLSTYAHYTHLTIRIYGINGFKTLRIHNYGNNIKIYYLQQTKKQKLTDHAPYLPTTKITHTGNQLITKYHDPRRKRTYTTTLKLNRYSNTTLIDKILEEENIRDHLVVTMVLNIDSYYDFLSKIGSYIKFNNKRAIGSFGERITLEYLRKKGFTAIPNSNRAGPDIFIYRPLKAVVEVKTTLNGPIAELKLMEARNQIRKYQDYDTRIAAVVIIDLSEPQARLILSPSPLFITLKT